MEFVFSKLSQSLAATEQDTKLLKKGIIDIINNKDHGLTYVKLDNATPKLVVFSDATFDGNKDFTYQLGYIVTLSDAKGNRNVIH